MSFVKLTNHKRSTNKYIFYYFNKRNSANKAHRQQIESFQNIKHSINEFINIPETYKYITQRFEKVDSLKDNLKRRKVSDIDIDQLHTKYKHLQDLYEKKNELEMLKFENAKLISDIKTKGGTLMNLQIDSIKSKGKSIKEKLKQILNSENGYRVSESQILPQLMSLPVDLDLNTPEDYITLSEEMVKHELCSRLNHVDVCKESLSFCDHSISNESKLNLRMHYLIHDLAKFEIKLIQKLHQFGRSKLNYEHIICPDIVKLYIANICEDDNQNLLILNTETGDKNHDLVLTGNSLSTYISYLMALDSDTGPTQKLYRIGRSYRNEEKNSFGLYKVSQNIQMDFFSSSGLKNANLLLEEQEDLLQEFYKSLNISYKLVLVPAFQLKFFESRRIDAFLWSPVFKKYFKSGYVRSCKDIFSRTLEIKLKNQYPHMNNGVFITLPSLIASLIEHHSKFSSQDLDSILTQLHIH